MNAISKPLDGPSEVLGSFIRAPLSSAKRSLAVASLGVLLSTQAGAVDYQWVGGAGRWDTPTQWSPSGVPGLSDAASIHDGSVIIEGSHIVDHLAMAAGTLVGGGALTIGSLALSGPSSGQFTWLEVPVVVTGHASITGNIGLRSSVKFGGVTSMAASYINGGSIVNGSSGSLTASSNADVVWDSEVNNQGKFHKVGSGQLRVWMGIENSGTVAVDAGTLKAQGDFKNTGDLYIADGARIELEGAVILGGKIYGNGTLYSGYSGTSLIGTVSPGDDGTFGELVVGGYMMSLRSSSVLQIDLGRDSQSDLLRMDSRYGQLGGELSLWGDIHDLKVGDVYTVVSGVYPYSSTSGSGMFERVTWHGDGNARFEVSYEDYGVQVRVLAVPEPQVYLLMLVGLALVGGTAARAKRGACSSL